MATKPTTTTVTVVTNETRGDGSLVKVRRTFQADSLGLESDGSVGRLVARSGRAPVAVFHDWSHAYLASALLDEQQEEGGELGESESLRLQMAMDRMSKMMQTLSNILKKIEDSDQSAVENVK